MTPTQAEFFSIQSIQSLTKSQIVWKYFKVWADKLSKIARARGETIRYVDLFSGPGRYLDGTPSTPLMILQHAIDSPHLHDLFVSEFNDAHFETIAALEQATLALLGVGLLKYQPTILNFEVDDTVAERYEANTFGATLTFIDPYGYAGLSARLIRATLKDPGSECIVFFNFNRINPAINNDSVESHVSKLFDTADAESLRMELKHLQPYQREEAVIRKFTEVLKPKYAKYVLNFKFLNDDANRTSHYLVFATKHPMGASIMKDIMIGMSSWAESGVPGFVCSPKAKVASLFDSIDPVPDLAQELLAVFAGRTVTVANIYREHGLDRPHTPGQYKSALKLLECEGKVDPEPPVSLRPKDTMADHVKIQFPKDGT